MFRFPRAFPRVNFTVIEVRYERGVYLPQQDLWLDPWDAKRFAFVSHAHSDHIALHDEIIASERTARLMRARLPGARTEYVLPFGQRRTVRDLDLMLLPAGHIFVSAQFSFSAGMKHCFTPAILNCALGNPLKKQSGGKLIP